MKLITVDKEHIKKTVEWWQNHTYATHSDIGRVERFRELDANTATADEVSAAYGGTGWTEQIDCISCGAFVEKGVEFYEDASICVQICHNCISEAHNLVNKTALPVVKKKPFYKFWE